MSERKRQLGDGPKTDVQPTIEHMRDIIWGDDGSVEQIYNHLIYRFGGSEIVARAYFDDPGKVSIMKAGPVPDEVLGYLKDRFWQIDQLGGEGFRTIWTGSDR